MPDTTVSPSLSAADHERAMSEYGQRAEARAHALGNRGPIRVGADGKLLPEILILDEALSTSFSGDGSLLVYLVQFKIVAQCARAGGK